jgi:hypothetical protein
MTAQNTTTPAQRITLDLSPQTAEELERLRELTGLTKSELFRHAFNLLRLYVRAAESGSEFCTIDTSGRERVIQLPMVVSAQKEHDK